jgi:hypothetical protein
LGSIFLFCYLLRIKTVARSTRICPWFSVLSETAVVLYKCDQYYNKESEGGIRFDDPTLILTGSCVLMKLLFLKRICYCLF